MRKVIVGLCTALFVACALTVSAQAATPQEVKRMARTFTPTAIQTPPGTSHRVMYMDDVLELRRLKVTLQHYSVDNSIEVFVSVVEGGPELFISDYCGYVIADDESDGTVDFTRGSCDDTDDGSSFFIKFGGAQALYDHIVEEAAQ